MRCGNCGASISPEAQFCGYCGDGVAAPPEPSAESNFRESTAHRNAHAGAQAGIKANSLEGSIPARDLSGILVETFRVFRSRPALFLVIGLIPQVPGFFGLAASDSSIEFILLIMGLSLLPITQGAVVHCVSREYAGLSVTVSGCLAASQACFARKSPLARIATSAPALASA